MLDIKTEGTRRIIDVRERIKSGEHPRGEIMKYVTEVASGTIIEIHLPHEAPPLTQSLLSLGMNVVTNEIEPGHFRMMAIKTTT